MYPEMNMAQEASTQRQRLIPAPVEGECAWMNFVINDYLSGAGMRRGNVRWLPVPAYYEKGILSFA